MNVIRTLLAPERRSLKRLSTKAATPAVRAQALAARRSHHGKATQSNGCGRRQKRGGDRKDQIRQAHRNPNKSY